MENNGKLEPPKGGFDENLTANKDDRPGDAPPIVPHRRRGRPKSATKKIQVTIRFDEALFEFYKKKAQESHKSLHKVIYQTLMDNMFMHTTASAAMMRIEEKGLMDLINDTRNKS